MRTPEYLSPTSVAAYHNNPEDFYLRYLSDHRPPRDPQTRPMSVGSAFDAYVKAYLVERIFGKGAKPDFEFEAIFEAQVEAHNRDWAREAGLNCMEQYKQLGALADLCSMLDTAISEPVFEIDVYGNITVDGYTIRFRGKPDCFFVNDRGMRIILDWKVNGYCAHRTTSPMQGYVKLRQSGKLPKTHKKCELAMVDGVFINTSHPLNMFNESWARQTVIYAWLGGCAPGSEFISIIHQLACKATPTRPIIRVAEHLSKISSDYQAEVFRQAREAHESIHDGHFFKHLSLEESKAKCELLDKQTETLYGPGNDPDDELFTRMTRS